MLLAVAVAACSLVLVNSADPKLVIYPPNEKILAPAHVSFGIICEGKPEDGEFTDMKWFNPDGEEIRSNIRKVGSILKLTFADPRVEDSGIYKCSALFSNTRTVEEEVRVEFYEPISIEDCPEVQNLVVGLEGQIRCRTVASPKPTVSWKKGGVPINSEMLAVNEFGLSIPIVSKEDEGNYSLHALVKETGYERVQKIDVNVLIRPNIVQMENITKEEGKVATFVCLSEGVPKPLMSIRREKSNEDIVDNPDDGIELEVFDDGEFKRLELRIANVKRSDDGLYFCKASNPAGVAERTGHLEVQFRPDMSRTQITTVKAWSGNPAYLTCIAEANPNATITWKFKNNPIEAGDDRFIITGGVSYSNLTVKTTEKSDVFGIYICEARNALGENSVQISLEAVSRPGALQQILWKKVTPTTITFRLIRPTDTGGMPITHYIMRYKLLHVEDDPVKEVTWEKDTPYIISNLIPRSTYQFSAAAINAVGVGDYREFTYGMPQEDVPDPPIIKTRQETLSEYADRFEVRWDEPSNNGFPIFRYIILYFKVERGPTGWNETEKAVEHMVFGDKQSFVMYGLTPDSYYKIEIRATNAVGDSLPESVVIKTSKGSAPTFTRDFEEVIAEEGTNLEIACKARSVMSNVDYAWYTQYEDFISHDSRLRVFVATNFENSSSTLVLRSVNLTDEGQYTCTAINDLGSSSKIYQLTVLPSQDRGGKPTFTRDFEEVTAEEGSNLEIACKAKSDIPIGYAWYTQYGDLLSEDSRLRVFVASNHENSSSTLVLRSVNVTDEGQYTCTATNDLGNSSKIYQLTVLPSQDRGNDTTNDKPSLRGVRIANITSNSVTFVLDIVGSVTRIAVRYKESLNATIRELSWSYGDVYEVKDLIPGGLYNFRFNVGLLQNETWSLLHEVILLPDTPEVVFRYLESGHIKVEWLRKSEDTMRGTVDKYELSYYTVSMQGDTWLPSDCVITIQIPSCSNRSYMISGLSENTYYEIQLRAHTASGFGEPYKQKILF